MKTACQTMISASAFIAFSFAQIFHSGTVEVKDQGLRSGDLVVIKEIPTSYSRSGNISLLVDRIVGEDGSEYLQVEGCKSLLRPSEVIRFDRNAIDWLGKAIQGARKPEKKAQLLYTRAYAWFLFNEWERALADIDVVIKSQPNERAFLLRSKIHVASGMAGHTRVAINDLNEALRINPRSSEGYRMRGDLYYVRRNDAAALADYSQSLQFNPNQAWVLHKRALVYKRQGEFQKARDDLETCVSLGLDSFEILSQLAWLLATCPLAEIRDGNKAVQYAHLLANSINKIVRSVSIRLPPPTQSKGTLRRRSAINL